MNIRYRQIKKARKLKCISYMKKLKNVCKAIGDMFQYFDQLGKRIKKCYEQSRA